MKRSHTIQLMAGYARSWAAPSARHDHALTHWLCSRTEVQDSCDADSARV